MRIAERGRWARDVLNRLEPFIGKGTTVVILAGVRYREFVEQRLRERNVSVIVPMKKLPIGKQLQWLARHRNRPDAARSASAIAESV